ncbi:hypothetical protein B7486_66605, partial [cyanobacterium TDX16]
MFDEATLVFLRSGCALIVGSASHDRQPLASRGWGIPALDPDGGQVTVLLDDEDDQARENLAAGARVAVTATDVQTLRSLQLKGTVLAVEPAAPEDPKVVRAYCDEFFGDVEAVDGMPRDILERMLPAGWFRCRVQVEATFDQTPGPSAG